MATRLGNLISEHVGTKLREQMCRELSRLRDTSFGDFKISYEFSDDVEYPCLRIAVAPANEWSKMAFKMIHDKDRR